MENDYPIFMLRKFLYKSRWIQLYAKITNFAFMKAEEVSVQTFPSKKGPSSFFADITIEYRI